MESIQSVITAAGAPPIPKRTVSELAAPKFLALVLIVSVAVVESAGKSETLPEPVVAEKVKVNSMRFHALRATELVEVAATTLAESTMANLPVVVRRIRAVLVAPDRKLTR